MKSSLDPSAQRRLNLLHETGLWSGSVPPELDALVRLAARVTGVPMAFVSLVGEAEVRFPATIGLEGTACARADALCAVLIEGSGAQIVPDATQDPRLADLPWVAGAPHLRLYAGVPLEIEDGVKIGMLAVADVKRRELPEDWEASLSALAAQVVALIRLQQLQWAADHAQSREENPSFELAESLERIGGRAARLGGWILRLPERKLIWSDPVFAIHDLPFGEVPPMAEAVAFYVEGDRKMVASQVETCIERGVPFDIEVELITAKKRQIWVRVVGEAVRDAAGRIVSLQGALMDLTGKRDAEQSIAAVEARLRQQSESLPFIVWTADAAGKVDYLNQVFSHYTGISQSADPGTRWQGCVHPDDLLPCVEAWDAARQKGVVYEVEYRLRRHDGVYRWFLVYASPIKDANGIIARWYGTGLDVNEVRETEAKTRRLVHRLEVTLESITDAFFTVDLEWRFSYMNAEAARVLRCDRAALMGENLWAAFPGALGTEAETQYRRAVAENQSVEFEYYFPPLVAWFEIHAYPSDEGLAVYFRDITARRAADEERRRLVRDLGERMKEQRTLYAISQLLREDTTPVLEVLKVVAALIPEALRFPEAAGSRILFGHHEVTSKEFSGTGKALTGSFETDDGTSGRVEVVYSKEPEGEDESEGFFLAEEHQWLDSLCELLRTYLNLRHEREALLLSENRFRDLFQNIPNVAVHGYLMDGTVCYWNDASERFYGYSREEAMGGNLLDLIIPEEMHETVRQALRALIGKGKRIPAGELELRRKDGSRITVYSSHAIVTRRDQQRELFCIDVDLSESKKLEQQFLRAQRMESIGTLAGGIAHDLNNLLSPIIMGVDLLRRFTVDERAHTVIESIERSARRGTDLVKQVLSFARGVEGARVHIQIGHLLRELEAIIGNTFPKNIQLEVSMPPEMPKVLGDPTQLNQVLLNLCVNARDAMPSGGRLSLAVRKTEIDEQYAVMDRALAVGCYVVLEVTDEGCGMSKEVMDRVFEPFFTTKEVGKGTGLGLSTVLGIIRSHGGFVNVYSEPRKGSVFKVYLPVAEAEEGTDLRMDRARESFPRGRGECILVVDDEVSILTITQQTLEAFGYRVLTAEDGAQGIALYAQKREEIALVLTDMMMPVMDGPALIAALRRIDPKVLIIAASGLNANGNVARAAQAGVSGFIEKPYSADTILQTLRSALDGQ